VVVTLPVELTCAGKFMPSFEVVGNGLAEQCALSTARVVEFVLATGLPVQPEKHYPRFIQRNVIVLREHAR
jgi:hypothetical protein